MGKKCPSEQCTKPLLRRNLEHIKKLNDKNIDFETCNNVAALIEKSTANTVGNCIESKMGFCATPDKILEEAKEHHDSESNDITKANVDLAKWIKEKENIGLGKVLMPNNKLILGDTDKERCKSMITDIKKLPWQKVNKCEDPIKGIDNMDLRLANANAAGEDTTKNPFQMR